MIYLVQQQQVHQFSGVTATIHRQPPPAKPSKARYRTTMLSPRAPHYINSHLLGCPEDEREGGGGGERERGDRRGDEVDRGRGESGMESVLLSDAFSTFLVVDKSNGGRRRRSLNRNMYNFKAADWSNKLRFSARLQCNRHIFAVSKFRRLSTFDLRLRHLRPFAILVHTQTNVSRGQAVQARTWGSAGSECRLGPKVSTS